MKRLLFLSTVLLVLFSGYFYIFPATAKAQGNNEHVSGQIIVKFKEGLLPKEINNELKSINGRIINKLDTLQSLVLKVPRGAEEKIVAALSKNPYIEYAELDYTAEVFFVPNDTFFTLNQWGLENTGQTIQGVAGIIDADIDGPTAWNVTTGSVKVAVLDTGIDQDHEDLASKIILNKDFTGSATSYNDLYGHGTHVAGIVAAVTNNNIGIAGSCPNCQLINGKVLNDSGSGAYSWIASGIIWAANNGAKVINMSLGGSVPSKTLERAINYAWNKNVVLVAAAGNSGNQSKTYPAAYTKVIAVAATDNQDKKASFSQYGTWVDVAAPGVNIFSTFPNHPYKINKSLGYDFASGTSMATPMTSAVAALIWSTPYGSSATAVRRRLESTADKIPGTGIYWVAGRVNAANAVSPSP